MKAGEGDERRRLRGWLQSSKVVPMSPRDGETKNDSNGLDVSTGATVSTENERNKIWKIFQVKMKVRATSYFKKNYINELLW